MPNFQLQSVGPFPVASGTDTTNVNFSVTTPVGFSQSLLLSLGDNTIAVPSAAGLTSFVLIQPPTTNTNVLTLKGVGGDTGIVIHPTIPTVLGLGPLVTAFHINASASTQVAFTWM